MKKLHIIYCAALLTGGLSGCSDFLQEYSQDSYYAQSWEDLDELLIGSCYLQPAPSSEYRSPSNIGEFLHFMTDEIEENNCANSGNVMLDNHERAFGVFTWQQRLGQNETYTDFYDDNQAWTKCYYGINVANNILAASETLPNSTETERLGLARVQGEAHFLRAYYYFWLVNLYGKHYQAATAATDPGVPIKLSENVEDCKFKRNSVQEVYDLVLSELAQAEELLGMQTASKKSIYRADIATVNLLQSRVHLYMQHYELAASYAQCVIKSNGTLQNLNGNTGKFLVKSNPEILFSMSGSDLPCLFDYAFQSYRVSHDLYDSYAADDLRKKQWYWTYGAFVGPVRTEPGEFSNMTEDNPRYYSERYNNSFEYKTLPVSTVFVMRASEAYLNYAEAEACLGHEGEALDALQTFRSTRYASGSANISKTSSGEELVAMVREERRKEFALEGHRWFDLRRYQVCEKYPYAKTLIHYYTYYADRSSAEMKICRKFVLEPGDGGYTLPIPENVVRFNTGMGNNPRPWREYEEVELRKN